MTDISPPSCPILRRSLWDWGRWNGRDRRVDWRESRGVPVESLPRRRDRERELRAGLCAARVLASRSPVRSIGVASAREEVRAS